jgi:hypothetical protein
MRLKISQHVPVRAFLPSHQTAILRGQPITPTLALYPIPELLAAERVPQLPFGYAGWGDRRDWMPKVTPRWGRVRGSNQPSIFTQQDSLSTTFN